MPMCDWSSDVCSSDLKHTLSGLLSALQHQVPTPSPDWNLTWLPPRNGGDMGCGTRVRRSMNAAPPFSCLLHLHITQSFQSQESSSHPLSWKTLLPASQGPHLFYPSNLRLSVRLTQGPVSKPRLPAVLLWCYRARSRCYPRPDRLFKRHFSMIQQMLAI